MLKKREANDEKFEKAFQVGRLFHAEEFKSEREQV